MTNTIKRKLLIANPTHVPGSVSRLPQLRAYQTPDLVIYDWEQTASLVTWSFNTAWSVALNLKEHEGLTHFLLIHSDIRPVNPDWLNILFSELDLNSADLISAVCPIKDERGLSSTAVDTDPWRPVRLTMKQIHTQLPETWYSDMALFNTGLLLVDFRRDWVYKVRFHMRDEIVRDESGRWTALVEPEDWNFSRQCNRLGLKCLITRKVTVQHFGIGVWGSDKIWGQEVDIDNVGYNARKEERKEEAKDKEKPLEALIHG